MPYPSNSVYICKFCGNEFVFSSGCNLPRLTEHLIKCHHPKIDERKNLYVSDLAKACFELKGGSND